MGIRESTKHIEKKVKKVESTFLKKFSRWVIVIVGYLIAFWLLDLISMKFQIYPGVVAWYPPDGVSLAMLYALGFGFAPIVVLGSIISSFLIYDFSIPLFFDIGWALFLALVYGAIAYLLRRLNPDDSKTTTLKNVVIWILISIVATFVLALVSTISHMQHGNIPQSQFVYSLFQWWIGEIMGLLVVTPFLLIHVTPRIREYVAGEKFNLPKISLIGIINRHTLSQIILTVLTLYLVFGVPAFQSLHPFFLLAVPLIWVAITDGFAKTTTAVFLSNIAIMTAIILFQFERSMLGEFQFLLFGIYTLTLLLATVVTGEKTSRAELSKQGIQFQALIENAPDAILMIGKDQTIIYASPSSFRMLGYDPEQISSIILSKLTHPDDTRGLRHVFANVLRKSGAIETHQYRIVDAKGTWRWVESTFTNQLENPNLNAIVINFRDITEKKLAEEKLSKSEKRFRALIEQSKEDVCLLNPDGTVTYESPNTNKSLGYPANFLVGKKLNDFFHPDEERNASRIFRETAQKPGAVQKTSLRVKHQDGSWRWMEGYISNMLDEPGVNSIVINYSDVTERKMSEEKIEVLARIADESPNPVARMSSDGVLLYANSNSDHLLSVWNTAMGQKVPNYMINIAAIAAARKENLPVEITCDERVYAITVTPIPERDYVNLYGRDITKRVQAEENLKLRNEELSQLFDLSHALAEANNLDDILFTANTHAVDILHNTFSRIVLLDGDDFVIRSAYSVRDLNHDLAIGERYKISSLPLSMEQLESKKALILYGDDYRLSDTERKALLLDFVQYVCLIPLHVSETLTNSGEKIGLLMLGEMRNQERQDFDEEKIRLAQTIADSAAVAIQKMLLREQTKKRLNQLLALSQIDLAIISNSDMAYRLDIVCSQVISQLNVDAVSVWKFFSNTNQLEHISGTGFKNDHFRYPQPIRIEDSLAGQTVLERQIIQISDLTRLEHQPSLAKAIADEQFRGFIAVPLIVKEKVTGVLEIFSHKEAKPTEEWMQFLQVLANQAAIAIDNSMLFNDLEQSNIELTRAYDATIQGWSRALDLRDNETEGHTQRVTELTMKICRLFGIAEEELVHVRMGALLHDIGKMGVPDNILLKPGPLTDDEWVIMKKHPVFAYELLSPINYLQKALDIPYCHHEKWDGSGYPRGLVGEEIPLAARIFSVVDVWDALTSDRPYRAAWSELKVIDYIRSLSGIQFDPQVVKFCLEPGILTGKMTNPNRLNPFKWTTEFSVGVKELDLQHQKLFAFLNRLIMAKTTSIIHSEVVKDILDDMVEYSKTHFTSEERLMEAHHFPLLEEHKQHHRDFENQTAQFRAQMEENIEETASHVLEYLYSWWTLHILEEDMAYKDFFNEKGIH